ncbi:MAG: ribose-5-phosphate isomerase A [Nanoarchaeota archaeon]|nr:ribose-5-phosphate isomerase A [Nanoarchaeota archaeon]
MKERQKLKASKKALEFLTRLIEKRKIVLGLGSGTTMAIFVKLLGESDLKKQVRVIPSSIQIRNEAKRAGLKTVNNGKPVISIDGSDQINGKKEMLKGHGALAFVKEKEMDYAARKVIFVADKSKLGELTKPVLVEVKSNKVKEVKEKLKEECKVLKEVRHNGNKVLFLNFGKVKNPKKLEQRLNSVDGILGNGIFAHFRRKPIIISE